MSAIQLSVNLNKIAWLRNARQGGRPDLVTAAVTVLDAGAYGVTIHPRSDQRHITTEDVADLTALLAERTDAEFNIEGNPLASARGSYPGLDTLVAQALPDQVTLVPDADGQLTSDHGWSLADPAERHQVRDIVERYHALGARVSLFMDPDLQAIGRVPETGADRIELYTESFADAVKRHGANSQIARDCVATFATAANRANELGLGVNAGHDLDLENLPLFRSVPHVLEVSIGHALISDALDLGLVAAVRAYLKAMKE